MSTIAFANNFYYLRGGSERVFFDEMQWLVGRGSEIIPFSRRHERNHPTPYDRYYLPAVDFTRMNGKSKAKAAIEVVYSLPMRRAFEIFVDEEKPNLVHGHNIYAGLTYSIIDVARKRGIPFVLTLHDLKLACPSYLMLNRGRICERCGTGSFWNCAVQRCHKESLAASLVNTAEGYFNRLFGTLDWVSRFLCPSRFLMAKVARAGIPQAKLVYLPNALDPKDYDPVFQPGAYALFAGRLSREKGVMTLLQAFRECKIPLRIAGTGPMEAECRAFAAANSMSHVTFCGHCQAEELQNLFREARFVLVPSEGYENAPMSVLEAFAYGKPVVGSRLGGIPELVLQGETGLLFDAGSAESLAMAVMQLWDDPASVERMGRAARHRIETEFNADLHTDRLLGIYEETLRTS